MSAEEKFLTKSKLNLPLRIIKGNKYLDVKWRVVWFREEHPDWSIETELLSFTVDSACAKSTIKDEKGRILSTSHKIETIQGFPDYAEKAETGAIGRALALIGYGTQFCDDLDEGNRIVDSGVEPKNSENTPDEKTDDNSLSEYVSPVGNVNVKGNKLKDIMPHEIDGAVEYFMKSANGTHLTGKVKEFHQKASAYLKQIGYERKDRYKK